MNILKNIDQNIVFFESLNKTVKGIEISSDLYQFLKEEIEEYFTLNKVEAKMRGLGIEITSYRGIRITIIPFNSNFLGFVLGDKNEN